MKNMDEKKEIRKRILGIRENMDRNDWLEKTNAISENVLAHPWFERADTIYCYVDFRGEAGTGRIMEKAWEEGKKVAVPRTTKDSMEFYYIFSLEETAPGNFGVMEPVTDRMADGKDGLMIMPGSVFDEEGHRIGYGKGYYDRYLVSHPGLHTMAIAFDFQVMEEIPFEPHDKKAAIIVTDRRIIDNRIKK